MADERLVIDEELKPMKPDSTGEGLPYAPENWPEQGDIWGWRTGRRVVPNGTHFQDRYLYLPHRLFDLLKEDKENTGSGSSGRKQHIFASKLAVERYVKKYFPDTDLNDFFASFTWKIPALSSSANGNAVPIAAVPLQQIALDASDSDGGNVVKCKANNKNCTSMVLEEVEKYSSVMPCDICCSEPVFCRDCCCILCSKTVCTAYGGFSYIKCQVNAGEGICGHVAHIHCALRCLLAGKVGGSIGLDVQYYCRRCDGRTDMLSHVNNLLQTCKTSGLEDDEILKKILNVGACLLRGSERPVAKKLLRYIELAISKVFLNDILVIEKETILLVLSSHIVEAYDQFDGLHQLKCGTKREDIWDHDTLMAHSTDNGNGMQAAINDYIFEVKTDSEFVLQSEADLVAEVDKFLEDFRKSQEMQYKFVEETLLTQKTFLQNLYEQLDYEKSELAGQVSSTASEVTSSAIRERMKQIKQEEDKWEDLKKIILDCLACEEVLKEQLGFNLIFKNN